MRRIIALSISLILFIMIMFALIIFLGQDRYRYECQDPENWSSPSCTPPICKASSTCTEDTLRILTEKVGKK
jgi:hypothetical protein